MSFLFVVDINRGFYNNFHFYCFDVKQKEISIFASYIKDIKTIMSYTAPESFKSKNFIIPGYEADTIYLTIIKLKKGSIRPIELF
jgi:hypothetical protein